MEPFMDDWLGKIDKMIRVIRFQEAKIQRRLQQQRKPHFTRNEMNRLLGLYANKLKTGEWKQYQVKYKHTLISFDVFHDITAMPVARIVKMNSERQGRGKYLLIMKSRKICQSPRLTDIFAAVDGRKFHVVR
jgi:hypothetical protein